MLRSFSIGFVFATALLAGLGCGGSLPVPQDCPPPIAVFEHLDQYETETVTIPDGCSCDAPLRPALTSAWPGGCSYTWEARCKGCTVDVTWKQGLQPKE